jgi:hypothetical protein
MSVVIVIKKKTIAGDFWQKLFFFTMGYMVKTLKAFFTFELNVKPFHLLIKDIIS